MSSKIGPGSTAVQSADGDTVEFLYEFDTLVRGSRCTSTSDKTCTELMSESIPADWDCSCPFPCGEYIKSGSPCRDEEVSLGSGAWDEKLKANLCVKLERADDNDPNFMLYSDAQSSSSRDCLPGSRSDGFCDMSNNHDEKDCAFDGGDCCITTLKK